MDTIGLWQITEGKPTRVHSNEVELEKDLEEWIESDPSLLERGLVIVGRQIRLEGGLLDLLALDQHGRWVLIEVKRDRLRREVIAQAIDYASSLRGVNTDWLRETCDAYLHLRGERVTISSLLAERDRSLDGNVEDRDVVIYLVGTSLDPALERMVEYLKDTTLAVRMVTFAPFRDDLGHVLLARTIHESTAEARPQASKGSRAPGAAGVLPQADNNGVGGVMRSIYDAAAELGLYSRTWGKGIALAPPTQPKRILLTVASGRQAGGPGIAKVTINAETFERHYGITEAELSQSLGIPPLTQVVLLDQAKADELANGLRKLLTEKS